MPPRWFAGIHISADCRRIEAALVGIHGRGNGAPIESRKSMSFDLPKEIVDAFQVLCDQGYGHGTKSVLDTNLLAQLTHELACLEEEALDELIAESRIPPLEILAVGLSDPGLWGKSDSGPIFHSLSSSELLAEKTGLNIVDSFPSRDIASGGVGGPLFPFPCWIILCSEAKNRILLDFGKTARSTFLPKPLNSTIYEHIEYADLVPCGSLLDELTLKLTHGKTEIDSGGSLTVQGKHIPELLSLWKNLQQAQIAPSWSPFGISPVPFLQLALEKSTLENWAIRDVLCTAVHFITESVATFLEKHYLPKEIEILLTGGCCRHGLLLNRLGKRLEEWQLTPLRDCGVPVDAFDAVCVAILTILFADHIPAAIQSLTRAETAQPLGHITPGSPHNWTRLIEEMSQTRSTLRNLRSVVNF